MEVLATYSRQPRQRPSRVLEILRCPSACFPASGPAALPLPLLTPRHRSACPLPAPTRRCPRTLYFAPAGPVSSGGGCTPVEICFGGAARWATGGVTIAGGMAGGAGGALVVGAVAICMSRSSGLAAGAGEVVAILGGVAGAAGEIATEASEGSSEPAAGEGDGEVAVAGVWETPCGRGRPGQERGSAIGRVPAGEGAAWSEKGDGMGDPRSWPRTTERECSCAGTGEAEGEEERAAHVADRAPAAPGDATSASARRWGTACACAEGRERGGGGGSDGSGNETEMKESSERREAWDEGRAKLQTADAAEEEGRHAFLLSQHTRDLLAPHHLHRLQQRRGEEGVKRTARVDGS